MEINKITFANKGSYAIAGAVGNLAFSTISYGLPTANKSVSEAATAHSLNVGYNIESYDKSRISQLYKSCKRSLYTMFDDNN